MALLLLARHAQASFGSGDYDRLSDLGHRQAAWLGEYFAARGLRFARVHTGTLRRQVDTASGVLAAMGAETTTVERDAGLNEYEAEALFRAHLKGQDPYALQRADYRAYWRAFRDAMLAWAANGLPDVPETWERFGQRMQTAVARACEGTGRDDVVLVVSSGGAIARLLSDVLQAPAATAIELNLQMRNSAFCELIVGASGMRLLNYNSLPHLDNPERREFITGA